MTFDTRFEGNEKLLCMLACIDNNADLAVIVH